MLSNARTLLSLVAAASMAIAAGYHFTRSTRLPFGQRLGTLVFELLLSAIAFGHFWYRLHTARTGNRGRGASNLDA